MYGIEWAVWSCPVAMLRALIYTRQQAETYLPSSDVRVW